MVDFVKTSARLHPRAADEASALAGFSEPFYRRLHDLRRGPGGAGGATDDASLAGTGGEASDAGVTSGVGGMTGIAGNGGAIGIGGSPGTAGTGGAPGMAGTGGRGSGGSPGNGSCAAVPVTPNATQQARNVLCYLYSQYGNHILSGQEESGGEFTGHAVAANLGHTTFVVTARHYVAPGTVATAASRRTRGALRAKTSAVTAVTHKRQSLPRPKAEETAPELWDRETKKIA